jgi:hypothetical protein
MNLSSARLGKRGRPLVGMSAARVVRSPAGSPVVRSPQSPRSSCPDDGRAPGRAMRLTIQPASVWSTDRRIARRGDVESAPVISAPASPDPEDSLSRGRVRKPDAPDPVVAAGPVGRAHSPPGMTVGTPGPGWIRPPTSTAPFDSPTPGHPATEHVKCKTPGNGPSKMRALTGRGHREVRRASTQGILLWNALSTTDI